MKRKLLFVVILTLGVIMSYAQDVIVFRNAEEVQAKVKEISPTTVSYVKWSDLNGPSFTVEKSKILYIKYSNGEKEVFNTEPASDNRNEAAASPKIKFNPTPSSKYIAGFTIGYVSQQYIYQESGQQYKYPVLGYSEYKLYTPTLEFGLDILPEFKYGIGLRTGVLFDFGFYHYSSYRAQVFGINIPLQISYRYEIFKDFSLFLRTGPTYNFKILWMAQDGSDFDAEFYDRNFFDCLWAINGGVRYKMFQLSVGGEFGLNNHEGVRMRKPIVLSFSFLFGKVGRKK